jgi:glycosyltransferase involved in cell wall biosynthesis
MAAGLPVLVSNRCGCYPELVRDKITGVGFDPEQAEQITELMLTCAGGGIDRTAMGRAAAAHMDNFSPQHFADGLIRAIDTAGTRS